VNGIHAIDFLFLATCYTRKKGRNELYLQVYLPVIVFMISARVSPSAERLSTIHRQNQTHNIVPEHWLSPSSSTLLNRDLILSTTVLFISYSQNVGGKWKTRKKVVVDPFIEHTNLQKITSNKN